MATLTNIYSDIDLSFSRQPVTGDISLVLDKRAVVASIKNLLLTNFYERLWQPSLGSNLMNILFENVDPMTETTLIQEIKNVLTNFEPRATIDSITVTADVINHGYNVNLRVFIGNSTTPSNIDLFLERIR